MKIRMNVPKNMKSAGLKFLVDGSKTCFYLVGVTWAQDPRFKQSSLMNEIQKTSRLLSDLKQQLEAKPDPNKEVDLKGYERKLEALESELQKVENMLFSPATLSSAVSLPFHQNLRALTTSSVSITQPITALSELEVPFQNLIQRLDGSVDALIDVDDIAEQAIKEILTSLLVQSELSDYLAFLEVIASYKAKQPRIIPSSVKVNLYNRRLAVE